MSGFAQDTPGLCVVLGIIIYSASFHFQKYPYSDDKSQDPPSPDSGHNKEKVWGLPSWKLSGQREVSDMGKPQWRPE